MRGMKWMSAAFGLLAFFAPAPAKAQAIGEQPTIGVIPDGVFLGVTPAVSADRRYVRLSVNTSFNTFNGFSTFPVPAAVGGGGGGFGAGVGGLGGGGALGGGANGGLFGPGAMGEPTGPVDYSVASSSFNSAYAQFLDAPDPTPAPTRTRAVRARKAPPAKRPAQPAPPATPAAAPKRG
jgi:hypothetical protein